MTFQKIARTYTLQDLVGELGVSTVNERIAELRRTGMGAAADVMERELVQLGTKTPVLPA